MWLPFLFFRDKNPSGLHKNYAAGSILITVLLRALLLIVLKEYKLS